MRNHLERTRKIATAHVNSKSVAEEHERLPIQFNDLSAIVTKHLFVQEVVLKKLKRGSKFG